MEDWAKSVEFAGDLSTSEVRKIQPFPSKDRNL
jgi:hypothetical protein